MKKLLFLVATLALTYINAQVKDEGTPISEALGIERAGVPTISLPKFDVEAEYRKATEDQTKTGMWVFARKFKFNLNFNNAGTWTTLPNGDRLWRLTFTSENAKTLNFGFENYQLAEGAKMYIHTPAGNYQGDFTAADNSSEKLLTSWIIKGNMATVEFYEPANKAGQSTFNITTVSHGFRTLNENAFRAVNDSGSCMYDANCPEGDGKEEQKRGTVILLSGTDINNGFCSGTLINNTSNNKVPLIITAFHCISTLNVNTTYNIAARFRHWSTATQCPGGGGAVANTNFYQFSSGATVRVKYSDADTGLLQLPANIPNTQDVCYVGWDRDPAVPTLTAGGAWGLHHPSGDVMKYSYETGTLVSTTVTIDNQFANVWRIPSWNFGRTEGGSSGSGLYRNSNGRLIGVLFGGSSFCADSPGNPNPGSAPNINDYYGRIHMAWAGGGTTSTRLSNWLDQTNTGVLTHGHLCNTFLSSKPFEVQAENFTIYPTASNGVFYIDSKVMYDEVSYEIYNISGQRLLTGAIENTQESIDLSAQAAGVYLLKITSPLGDFSKTYKLIRK
jgi:hypothetical protein